MFRLTAATVAAIAAASVFVAFVRAAPSGAGARCENGYSYAGYASRGGVHGIAATITARGRPIVTSGHAAAWVGVGDKREWLQTGVAAFPRVGPRLYVEAVAPGAHRIFVDLGAAATGRRYRVAVVEVAPGRWQASIDGRRVTATSSLPAPRGSWRGIATAETWSAAHERCNSYRYRFDGVAVLGAGRWSVLARAQRVGRRVDGAGAAFSAQA